MFVTLPLGGYDPYFLLYCAKPPAMLSTSTLIRACLALRIAAAAAALISAARIPIMTITTNSSTSVKLGR